jgi:hypothetical protein
MNPQDDKPVTTRKRGPQGGKTTVSRDGAMIRKTFFVDWDVDELLQKQAKRKHLTEAQLLRQILRDHFGVE